MGGCRLSKRLTQQLMRDLFGLEMSLGAVVGCQSAVSQALETPYEEAVGHARNATVKYVDETSWRESNSWCWLWTMATAHVVVFSIAARRCAKTAQQFLGEAVSFIVSDRAGAYHHVDLRYRQLCWAHLLRDFAKIAARGAKSARVGAELLKLGGEMFHAWHRVRDGTTKRETFRKRMMIGEECVSARLRAALVQGKSCGNQKTERTCANLLKVFPAMWTFVDEDGVEPTNNFAEQSVRHGVIYRKLSGGTQSARVVAS